jgi:formylglycine-generating enzyme required for sulfatase activity
LFFNLDSDLVMKNKNELFRWASCAAILLAVSCAELGNEKTWDNPFDPGGVNWHPPTAQAPNDTNVALNDTVILRAAGHDENGSVVNFLWSFDHGMAWPVLGTPEQPARYVWGLPQVGRRMVWVKARDNDGVMSLPDSFSIMVHEYRPLARRMNDTIVSQQATVTVAVTASDSNGAIVKYYWKTAVNGPWSDSTLVPQYALSHPEGGGMTLVWGACDHDGFIACDTFAVLFNRGPTSVEMQEPRAGDTARFTSYDFIEETGSLRLRFLGIDPDTSADTLTYALFLGTQAGALAPAWTGRALETVVSGLPPSTRYYWKLQLKDLFGDSIAASGAFITQPAPGGPRGMVLIRSEQQSFPMGLPGGEMYETPVHTVAFSYHFWIDTSEVTRQDYGSVMNLAFDSGVVPITGVNWYDAALYCNARSKRDGKDTVYRYTHLTGTPGKSCLLEGLAMNKDALGYRLPTEAEWEYASRAGSQEPYFWGIDIQDMDQYVWYRDNSGNSIHPVGLKKANPFNLYDMYGNAWEWCNDWFGADYYSVSPSTDPAGPATGQERVLRGGSYANSDYYAQSGVRSKIAPATANGTIGFRVVLQHP